MNFILYSLAMIFGLAGTAQSANGDHIGLQCRTVSKSCEPGELCTPGFMGKWYFYLTHPRARSTLFIVAEDHIDLLGTKYRRWVGRDVEMPPYDETFSAVNIKPETVQGLVFRFDCSQAHIIKHHTAGCGQINHNRFHFDRRTGSIVRDEFYINAINFKFPLNKVYRIEYGYCDLSKR